MFPEQNVIDLLYRGGGGLEKVWGVQMLDSYLFGTMFTIQIDHNPIQWLNSVKAKIDIYCVGAKITVI